MAKNMRGINIKENKRTKGKEDMKPKRKEIVPKRSNPNGIATYWLTSRPDLLNRPSMERYKTKISKSIMTQEMGQR